MSKILLFVLLIIPIYIHSQEEDINPSKIDSIYRIVFDDDRPMLFGSGIKLHEGTVELQEMGTGKTIYVKKDEIDYIKTPYGYLWFEERIRDISLAGNRSIRVMVMGCAQLGGKFLYPGETRKPEIHSALSFEMDFVPWIATPNEFLDLRTGLGAEYQLPRKIKDYPGKFNFISFFAVGKLSFLNKEMISPFLFSRYGINFFKGNKDFTDQEDLYGGYYFSAGVGIAFTKKFELRGSYSLNKGYVDIGGIKQAVRLSYLDVTLGIIIR